MSSANCTPSRVHEIFRSLLSNISPTATSPMPYPTISASPLEQQQQQVSLPPAKNSIRYIEHDTNHRREKYDGYRWRLACTWNSDQCTNIAYRSQLCAKHNALRQNKVLPKRKRKSLLTHSSLPNILTYPNNRNNNDDDDDIQILEEYCKGETVRHSMSSKIKTENHDFHAFSVENHYETNQFKNFKLEPMTSSSYQPTSSSNDIEYISSKVHLNGLNISELISKNIPPLTEFEEEYLANRLIERFPINCLMLDAQLFIHNEAIAVVKRNYRQKMEIVAPEYFYDFLLRHPRVALHYQKWFSRCKQTPPTTGCPIDTKLWTLAMTVRGATMYDNMIDENTD